MAKELPYFKFEPNEWENGNIQFFNRSLKGLFIDLCSMYWSRLGDLDYALALQKLCNGNTTELDLLMQRDIFIVQEDKIIIEFLDEQLNEFQETSVKRRNAANKRWKNALALQKQSKSNAIREDKSREDEIINIYNKFVDEVKNGNHSQAIDMIYMKLKIKKGSLTPLLKEFKGQLVIDQTIHKNTLELRKHFHNWLNTQERVGKLDQYKIKT